MWCGLLWSEKGVRPHLKRVSDHPIRLLQLGEKDVRPQGGRADRGRLAPRAANYPGQCTHPSQQSYWHTLLAKKNSDHNKKIDLGFMSKK